MPSLHTLLLIIPIIILGGCKSSTTISTINSTPINTIPFVKSPYGLLFTEIEIEGKKAKAMIDFGDPFIIQISSTFVKENNIEVNATSDKFFDIHSNEFAIDTGTVQKVTIGNKTEENIPFKSSDGEMEGVSKQINTEFHAVVGWGYFKQYYTALNYSNNQFTLYNQKSNQGKALFTSKFAQVSSYLSIPFTLNGQDVNAIIDTGSPVTVIDKTLAKEHDLSKAEIKIADQRIPLTLYEEDLTVLSDLNVKAILGGDLLSQYKVYIDPFENQIDFYSILH